MRFSIYLNAQTNGASEDVQIIQTLCRQAKRAVDAGFVGVTLTEHHFSGYNTYGNPFMLASYLAPQLRRGAKFMIAVAVPPLHNPMRLAQEVNLLDILTEGNVIVGFAAGGSPLEYAGMGRDVEARHAEMFDNLAIMEAALAKDPEDPPLEWRTPFEHGTLKTRIMPGGFHRRHPEFARATQSADGVRWTAEKGWYLFTARETAEAMAERMKDYFAGLEAAGFSAETIAARREWSLVQKQVFVAKSDAEAVSSMRERLKLMAEHQQKSFGLVRDLQGSEKLRSVVGVSPRDPDEFLERAMLVGSPETVAKQIDAFAAADVHHLALLFHYGFMTEAESDRSLDLFLTEVLPRYQDSGAAGRLGPVPSVSASGMA
jgi:alkanesulfonate monooxygenase SsuD/methylene tetrahydromethanopterin reductase-like flavin-dependent oxidoreductase (luciferase family)